MKSQYKLNGLLTICHGIKYNLAAITFKMFKQNT